MMVSSWEFISWATKDPFSRDHGWPKELSVWHPKIFRSSALRCVGLFSVRWQGAPVQLVTPPNLLGHSAFLYPSKFPGHGWYFFPSCPQGTLAAIVLTPFTASMHQAYLLSVCLSCFSRCDRISPSTALIFKVVITSYAQNSSSTQRATSTGPKMMDVLKTLGSLSIYMISDSQCVHRCYDIAIFLSTL